MKNDIFILGGGMVGVLAKWLFPLATVLDWRQLPPRGGLAQRGSRMFGAQYLWEPLPGLPCQPFQVQTTIDGQPASIASAAAYKHKIGKPEDVGKFYEDGWMRQFASPTTGWMLEDLPGLLTENFYYNVFIQHIDWDNQTMTDRRGKVYNFKRIISTIPLYSLLEMVGVRKPGSKKEFTYRPIHVKTAPIPPDAELLLPNTIRVNYISDPNVSTYRTTDRDGLRHYEWLAGGVREQVATKVITPGKIWPYPNANILVRDLDDAHIHCFGRFGTWSPDELLHQTFKKLLQFKNYVEWTHD